MALNLAGFRAEYELGIEEIDDQHKRFFGMLDEFVGAIDDLYAPLTDEDDRRVVLTTVNGLRDYALVHFRTEEDLMREHGFPGLRAHRREHDTFMAKVLSLLNELECGATMPAVRIHNFMHDWYRDHILSMDKALAEFLALPVE